jgi:MFS family permease
LRKPDNPIPTEGRFISGWIIVGLCFFTLAIAYGVGWYSFSVFLVALIHEFNWGRSLVAGAFSLFMVLHGLIGPFAGTMVDRYGPRVVFISGSLVLATGFLLNSIVRSSWQFYISFGLISAVGVGLIGWVPNTTVIQQWFRQKRGLPMGIISSGVGIGIFVCVPLIQHLIDSVGWRMTYRIMALFVPFFVISMVTWFLRKPLNSVISGHARTQVVGITVIPLQGVNVEWSSQSCTLRQAVVTRQFWLLGASFFLASFTIHAILTHHVVFLIEQGLTALSASYIAGMIGVVSIGAKIFWGTLSDRIGREITYTIGIACAVCGILLLTAFSSFSYRYLPHFYALFFGLGYAAGAALPPLIAADLFQGKAYGSIFGILMMLNNAGGACGSLFAGFVYDQMQSYIPAFIVMIVCSLFALINIWIAAPRKSNR